MKSEPGKNLNLVLSAWFAALAAGNVEPVGRILDDEVVWEGRYPGQACQTPPEVLGFLSQGISQTRRITRLEAHEDGDDVIIVAHGPDFKDVSPDGTLLGPRPSAGMIFTVRDGRVVHMKGIDG